MPLNRMTEKIAYALGQIAGSLATIGVGIGVLLTGKYCERP